MEGKPVEEQKTEHNFCKAKELRQKKFAGVTGLEAEPFCSFPREFEREIGQAHNWVHKKMSCIGTDCLGLALMLGS
jgi:hypothetical protein